MPIQGAPEGPGRVGPGWDVGAGEGEMGRPLVAPSGHRGVVVREERISVYFYYRICTSVT